MPIQTPPALPAKAAKALTAATPAEVAATIRAVRIAAGLSQDELAAKLKAAQANIVRVEKGRSLPSTKTLLRIARATGHKLLISFVQDL